MKNNLPDSFGNIDIYLFDQLLKGRFDQCQTILDAGCGRGRNLPYFLRNNFEVYGVDTDPSAIEEAKRLSLFFAPGHDPGHFQISPVEHLPFDNNFFDLVISSAVLHFAKNKMHFEKMLFSMWRVLKSGGFLFVRLASDIGIEAYVKPISEGRFLLPDGSDRFLVNQQDLLNYTIQLKGILLEPIKTTNVQNLRCMTTWCVQKTTM